MTGRKIELRGEFLLIPYRLPEADEEDAPSLQWIWIALALRVAQAVGILNQTGCAENNDASREVGWLVWNKAVRDTELAPLAAG
jgi:hypothetical protein